MSLRIWPYQKFEMMLPEEATNKTPGWLRSAKNGSAAQISRPIIFKYNLKALKSRM